MTQAFYLSREDIAQFIPLGRARRRFELLQASVIASEGAVESGVVATDALRDATYITLSANAELPNERVLLLGAGLGFTLTASNVTISLTNAVPRVQGGFLTQFVASGDTILGLPLAGFLATRANAELLENKTLDAPAFQGLGNYADDAAAAAGGVGVGYAYRNGSALMVRVA